MTLALGIMAGEAFGLILLSAFFPDPKQR